MKNWISAFAGLVAVALLANSGVVLADGGDPGSDGEEVDYQQTMTAEDYVPGTPTPLLGSPEVDLLPPILDQDWDYVEADSQGEGDSGHGSLFAYSDPDKYSLVGFVGLTTTQTTPEEGSCVQTTCPSLKECAGGTQELLQCVLESGPCGAAVLGPGAYCSACFETCLNDGGDKAECTVTSSGCDCDCNG